MTAARVTRGASSLSSSSHFPLIPYSNRAKPVALPPGRARLSTKPAPTGSATCTNTIGTLRVACNKGATVTVPEARRASGSSATSSAAYLRKLSASPPPSDGQSECSFCFCRTCSRRLMARKSQPGPPLDGLLTEVLRTMTAGALSGPELQPVTHLRHWRLKTCAAQKHCSFLR